MTVSFVGSASAEATSLTLPTHQAGDLIVMFAGRTGSAIMPTIPAGWRFVERISSAGTTPPALAGAVAWKIASNNSEVSGTWTSASMLLAVVIRDDANLLVVGGANRNVGNSTTVTWVAMPPNANQASPSMRTTSAFILLPVLATSNTSNIETAPTAATTNIVSLAGTAAIEMAIHRTNAEVASFASTNYTANESVRYATWTIEVLDTGYAKSAGGGMLIHPGMSGGMRG